MSQLLTIMPNKFLDLQDFQQSVVPISLLVKKVHSVHIGILEIFLYYKQLVKNDG